LNADAGRANVASQRVLEKAGFAPEGACIVGGKPGIRFSLHLRSDIGPPRRADGRPLLQARAELPIDGVSDSDGTQRDEPFPENAPRAINNRPTF
jgi:hypothetical protein